MILQKLLDGIGDDLELLLLVLFANIMTFSEMVLEAVRKDIDVDFVSVVIDSDLIILLVLARSYIWSDRSLNIMALRLLQKRLRLIVLHSTPNETSRLYLVLQYLAVVIGRAL